MKFSAANFYVKCGFHVNSSPSFWFSKLCCVWAWPVGDVARKDFMDRYVLQLAESCGLE